MKKQDPYQVLGVPRSAAAEEIRSAYRSRARQLHPDASGRPETAADFQRLTEAYETLRDPASRAAHDREQVRADEAPPRARPPAEPMAQPRRPARASHHARSAPARPAAADAAMRREIRTARSAPPRSAPPRSGPPGSAAGRSAPPRSAARVEAEPLVPPRGGEPFAREAFSAESPGAAVRGDDPEAALDTLLWLLARSYLDR